MNNQVYASSFSGLLQLGLLLKDITGKVAVFELQEEKDRLIKEFGHEQEIAAAAAAVQKRLIAA